MRAHVAYSSYEGWIRPYALSAAAPTDCSIFLFNPPATPVIYTLSLHDALPIFDDILRVGLARAETLTRDYHVQIDVDRKSTRLNSSHVAISYAVFCLKKKRRGRSRGRRGRARGRTAVRVLSPSGLLRSFNLPSL